MTALLIFRGRRLFVVAALGETENNHKLPLVFVVKRIYLGQLETGVGQTPTDNAELNALQVLYDVFAGIHPAWTHPSDFGEIDPTL